MKVLLVEDSATVAAFVCAILRTADDFEVLPVAADAASGVRRAAEQRPDIVLMDVMLPDHDGVWAIEEIMAEAPCPIVVLSGHLSATERDITFEALRAGAVDVMPKPTSLDPQSRESFCRNLVSSVRLMSRAKVVRRSRPSRTLAAEQKRKIVLPASLQGALQAVLLGASTGGPPLLFRILSALPSPYPWPIVIVQHTLEGFDKPLAEWLRQTGHDVAVADDGPLPAAGQVRVAPADRVLRLHPGGCELVPLTDGTGLYCIDETFESAASLWGAHVAAVIMSGMGQDGARGLLALHEAGAVTLAQRPDTCVVPSMPASAIARGAVQEQLSPDELTAWLLALAETRGSKTFNLRSQPAPVQREG